MIRALALLVLSATPAAAADVHFCWTGANGYTMSGRMSFPDALAEGAVVTESEVTDFSIAGFRDGLPLGRWSLDMLAPGTSWNLNYDPSAGIFLTGEVSSGPFGQQWNADGNVSNCGSPGFGFNSGQSGQDICVDGTYVIDSTVPPGTPFAAKPVTERLDCPGPPQLALLP